MRTSVNIARHFRWWGLASVLRDTDVMCFSWSKYDVRWNWNDQLARSSGRERLHSRTFRTQSSHKDISVGVSHGRIERRRKSHTEVLPFDALMIMTHLMCQYHLLRASLHSRLQHTRTRMHWYNYVSLSNLERLFNSLDYPSPRWRCLRRWHFR